MTNTFPCPLVSFEFFPPANEKMEQSLWQAVIRLAPLAPDFVSVTYGAGGSTREHTHATVTRIQRETGLNTAAHLTCAGATAGQIDEIARTYHQAGIGHIVALRGDPPAAPHGSGGFGSRGYRPHPGGYPYAADMVRGLRAVADFEITVAAYPEGHPESSSPAADLDNLKRKIDAGATRALSQFFFDTEALLSGPRGGGWHHRAYRPRNSAHHQLRAHSQDGPEMRRCHFANTFEGLDQDAETRQLIAVTMAVRQCQRLQENGIDRFHFYTLNRADLTVAICHILGVRSRRLSPS
jgi:methylenetetrahydrofolate reductase (NADPH)